MIRLTGIFASLVMLHGAGATPPGRLRFSMDPAWRFQLGDLPQASAPAFDDRSWRRLDLPHDWSIEGTPTQGAPGGGANGYFPTGIGWYRKTFRLPVDRTGRRAWLEFDGVYMNSDVWINGVHLGHRPFGAISFRYDVTDELRRGTNVIAVRVDNSRQPSARWYTGSGIDRHVWLELVAPVHVAHWGTTIVTRRADAASATVAVTSMVRNQRGTPVHGTATWTIHDSGGHAVAHTAVPFDVAANDSVVLHDSLVVSQPQRWSVEHPVRYTLATALGSDGTVLDTTIVPFGIRTTAWSADSGFMLNGMRVKLQGVNLHADAGALGTAVPARVWRDRLAVLRAGGVNAIRTAHTPPDPEFLDLCDQMGFLVLAEAFDEWTFGKVAAGYHLYFAEWSDRDLRDFVDRDRNHPAIVLWSVGNEIGEQSVPGDDSILRRLVAVVHHEDPTRPVTTGNDQIDADGHPARTAFLEAEDVVGYNYVDRWHERRELMAEPDRHAHPDWKMVGTESGSIFQSFDDRPTLGDSATVRANYATGMIEAERVLKWVTLHDYFAGNFIWTGIDYLGESFWPFKGFSSGLVDITGRPKDAYYLYQSRWTDAPMLHIVPHWSWPGRAGQAVPVLVYSNCNSVELFLNGHSLGEQAMEFPAQGTSGGWNSYALPRVNSTTDDLHLRWDVPYQPGLLEAVGRNRNGDITCHSEVRTAGAAVALRASSVDDTVTTGMGDVAMIRIAVVDSAGTVVPSAANDVHVTVTNGAVVVMDNADQRDHQPYRTDTRHAYNGWVMAVIRPAGPGLVRVTASAAGLRPADATFVATAAPPQPAIGSVR